ncbi:MAG: nucleoside kinase [Candidatus Izimaplasma sp.]|nr:nucleoside kinase [Candidatus Izimaplasma bacterium]
MKSSKIFIHYKRGDIIKITINDKVYEYDKPVVLEEIAKKYEGDYYAALVNNRLRELSYRVSKDAKVELLDYSFYDSTRIYATSMRYLVAMATYRTYPEIEIKFSNSIAMGIYGRGVDNNINREMLNNIIKEMNNIISADYKISRSQVSIQEAKDYYKSLGYDDKVNALEYRKEKVNIYSCDDYKNYMYGYMVPSTGYLKDYEIHYLNPGFLIQYPRREEKGEIPEFVDSPKFFDVLSKSEDWAVKLNVDMIYKMNKRIEKGNLQEFIDQCENNHKQQLKELAEKISNHNNVRLIAIAGPSSSGKTTFSKRLEEELLKHEIKPLMISIDNYYLPVEKAPIDENGEPDLEHILSLDIDLFNQNMTDLIDGKKVALPIFDFMSRERVFSKPFQINSKTPIIIEGIHALNDKLSEKIPKSQKFKIYISPFTQINIDYNNPINLTDLRLLRRIVRDLQFRNTSPEKTLDMWPSVRRGEYKWIYPHIENSDYIFNSELTYEFALLKQYAEDALNTIDRESKHFIQANRLLKFLKYLNNIDSKYVPKYSLLREFIGGSKYEH